MLPPSTPNPGSIEAIANGCLCPVMDNHYGRGIAIGKQAPIFWYSQHCPLHDQPHEASNDE